MTEVRRQNVFQGTTMTVFSPALGIDGVTKGTTLDETGTHIHERLLFRQLERVGSLVDTESRDAGIPGNPGGIRE